MTSYLDNLKWIVSGQKETNTNTNTKLNTDSNYIQTDNYDELNSLNGSESDSDYDKIMSKDICINSELKNTNQTSKPEHTLKSIQEDYNKIHNELVKKEQLVRNRVNSDTVEKIKQNYTEFINDDVQIIKDFATVMETFEHIKEKLKDFEIDIKEFEDDIKKNSISQDINKQELDNKINQIDLRLENTVQLMNQIKFNGDEFIKKIIHLENLIQTHDEHRKEILSRLEKFDKEHNEMKNHNLRILNFFHDYQYQWIFSNYNLSNYNNYFKYIGVGLGICSVFMFGYKFLKK